MAWTKEEASLYFKQFAKVQSLHWDMCMAKLAVQQNLLPFETIRDAIDKEGVVHQPVVDKNETGYGAFIATINQDPYAIKVWTTDPYRYETLLEAENAVYEKYLQEGKQ